MRSSSLIRLGGLAAMVGGVVYAGVAFIVEQPLAEYLYYMGNIGFGFIAVLLPLQRRSKHLSRMRSWKDESLLRRPAQESSPSRPPARDAKVPGRPTLFHQPLLGQALLKTRQPGRVSHSQEGRWTTSQSRRSYEEASRRGHKEKACGYRRTEAPLSGGLCRQDSERTYPKEAPKADGLQPKKRTVGAMERDEWQRAAWRVTLAQEIDARRLVFVDEIGTNTSLSPLYGWAKKGERAYCSVPRNRGKNTTLLSSMSVEGMGPSLAVEGATDRRIFETYVERVLAPTLRPGQVVVMDNLTAHKGGRVKELIEEQSSASSSTCHPILRTSTPLRRLSRRSNAS